MRGRKRKSECTQRAQSGQVQDGFFPAAQGSCGKDPTVSFPMVVPCSEKEQKSPLQRALGAPKSGVAPCHEQLLCTTAQSFSGAQEMES